MNKISENKVKELIKELKKLSNLKDSKRKINYWYQQKQNIINSENISIDLIKEFLDEYSRVKTINNKIESVETDDRAITNVERDENGLIQYYSFEIFRKNSPALIGKLDRKEMETIYKLYTIYGANLTQKIVSREFPQYTFIEFKRILKAFNIYKSNSEFAPHIIEEKTEEELLNLHNQNKENNVLRKIEKDQLNEANKLINKLAQKINTYENKKSFLESITKSDFSSIVSENSIKRNIENSNSLIVYLSDLHIGSLNEKYGYIKLEDYNESEIKRRLLKVFDLVFNNNYDSIIIVNLGDSVDSYNKETTRGGHEIPTNLSNKEQSQLYIEIMLWFFKTLKQYNNNISYYCIGESNHDGDWGWLNNVALSYQLNNLGINTYISDQPIDKFDINNISIVYLHGKDIKNQFKQFPLTLNEKTENWFNNYFIESKLQFKEKICVVKGDLHQPAFTNCSTFDYISAPSVYGSSQYIVANFGKTKWGILYMEIDKLNNIKQGLIRD